MEIFDQQASPRRKPTRATDLKRMEFRVMDALASHNGRHKSADEVVKYLKEIYKKLCKKDTAFLILLNLSEWGFVNRVGNTSLWMITLEGSIFLNNAVAVRPSLREKTTSPNLYACV